MISVTKGSTRWVLLIGGLAIKVPRIDFGARQFALGLLANSNEYMLSRAAGGDRRLARTHAVLFGGLVAVAERVGPPIRRLLTRDEALDLPLREFSGEPGVDDNGFNVGKREDGSLVVLDYGNPGLMYAPKRTRSCEAGRAGC